MFSDFTPSPFATLFSTRFLPEELSLVGSWVLVVAPAAVRISALSSQKCLSKMGLFLHHPSRKRRRSAALSYARSLACRGLGSRRSCSGGGSQNCAGSTGIAANTSRTASSATELALPSSVHPAASRCDDFRRKNRSHTPGAFEFGLRCSCSQWWGPLPSPRFGQPSFGFGELRKDRLVSSGRLSGSGS